MAHHYYVPFEGREGGNGAVSPAHVEDVEADPSTYRFHYVANQGVYVASASELSVYEDLADDDESAVARYDADAGEYPAPDEDADDEYVCDHDGCDASFDSQASLNAHKGSHSR